MKNVMKQLLKAVCYVLLFLGIQVIVGFIFEIGYGIKIGMEAAENGVMLDEQAILEGGVEFLTKYSNWMVIVSNVLTIFALWLIFRVRKKKFYQEALLCKVDKKKIVPIVVLGIASSFFVSCVLGLLPIPESILKDYVESSAKITSGAMIIRIFSTVILAPIAEEIIFRGLVLSRLKKAVRPSVAIIISSLLFGLVHGQVLWMIYTFAIGIMFAIVAESLQSVSASILLHMSFNAVSLLGDISFSNLQMIIVALMSLIIVIGSLYFIIKKNEKTIGLVSK